MSFGAFPFGGAPFGGSGDGTDYSVPSPVTRLFEDGVQALEHLLVLQPYDPATGARVKLLASGGNYGSAPDGTWPDGSATTAGGEFFGVPVLEALTLDRSVLDGYGDIALGSQSYGQIVLADPLREIRGWLAYSWQGAPIDYYLGAGAMITAPPWPLSYFVNVFSGKTTQASASLDRITISVRDVIDQLQSDCRPTFSGRGACIEFDGVSGVGVTNATCPAGSMTMRGLVWLKASGTAGTGTVRYIHGWQNSNLPGMRLLRYTTGATDRMEFRVINDAGTAFAATFDAPPSQLNKWIEVIGRLDTETSTISLWIADLSSATATAKVAETTVAGAWTTVLANHTVARRPDGASLYLYARLDEIGVWSRALADQEIRDLRGKEATESEMVLCLHMNEATGSTAYDASPSAKNCTLSGTTKWVGSLTGGTDIRGKRMPACDGKPRMCSPVLVDPVDNVYMVDYRGFASIGTWQDKGLDSFVNDGDVADLYDAAAPAAGHYKTDKARGLVRINATATGEFTCTVNQAAAADAAAVALTVVRNAGIADALINLGAAATLTATQPAEIGYYYGLDDIAADARIGAALGSIGATRYVAQGGILTFWRLVAPAAADSTGAIGPDDILRDDLSEPLVHQAASKVRVEYLRYATTLDYTASSTALAKAIRNDLGQEYRAQETSENASVLAANSSAQPAVYQSGLLSAADALAEANRRNGLRSVDRRTYELPLATPRWQWSIGRVLFVQVPVWDLDDGKYVVVVGMVNDPTRNRQAIKVYG